MKTIFLSLPMKNRKDQDIANTIEAMKRVIKAMYPDEELQFFDNFEDDISDRCVEELDYAKNDSLIYLGEAIKKMAYCDHIASIQSRVLWVDEPYHGCQIEEQVADRYGLKPIILSDPTGEVFIPDLRVKAEEEATKEYVALTDDKNIASPNK